MVWQCVRSLNLDSVGLQNSGGGGGGGHMTAGSILFCTSDSWFRSCNFHICIFPRPQNSALSKYLQVLCGCAWVDARTRADPCVPVHIHVVEYERLISYAFWINWNANERKECQLRHRAQNCRMCRISNEWSTRTHTVKTTRHIMILFRCYCGF